MSRVDEIREIEVPERHVWLARQLDELDARIIDGLSELRDGQTATHKLLANVGVGVICALVAFPIGLTLAAIGVAYAYLKGS